MDTHQSQQDDLQFVTPSTILPTESQQTAEPLKVTLQSSQSSPDDPMGLAKELQHISNRPKLKRQQQRRTTFIPPTSPKKSSNGSSYRRPLSASSPTSNRSSAASRESLPPLSMDELNNNSNNQQSAPTSTTPRARPVGAGKQVLPPIPPGGFKKRRSLSTSRKSNKDSSKNEVEPSNESLVGTLLTVFGALLTVAGGIAAGYYYYTKHMKSNQDDKRAI